EEEESFLRTLSTGINLLEAVIAETKQAGSTIVDWKSRFLFVLLPSYFTRIRMLLGKNGKKNHYIE
ncbi:hypothetical protein AAER81_02150, partial [Acinetobacter baumannii]|uniref:hypothetical protein n=1 Tax=Acinetobacter baumannii TaxID=470 RepID=UPI0031F3C163